MDDHDVSVLYLAFDEQVTQDFRLDYYGCRLRVHKRTLSQQWDYIPDVVNRAIYPNWGASGPTWCNQYARELSKEIFGSPTFPSLSANDLHDHMSRSPNYVKINDGETNYHDPAKMIDLGYMVFFVQKKAVGSGHVEVGLPQNITSINSNGNTFQLTQGLNYTIGAGTTLGAKDYVFGNSSFDKFLYLGHLTSR